MILYTEYEKPNSTYFIDFLHSAGSDEDSDEDSDDESDWDEDDEESEEEGGYDLDICPPGCDQVIKVFIASMFLVVNTSCKQMEFVP